MGNNKNISYLIKDYPWLKTYPASIKDYIHPLYYERLLKDYVFKKKTDLAYFEDNLKLLKNPVGCVLELGSGSGRGTDIFLKNISTFKRLDLVDLSPHMIAWLKNKYRKNKKIKEIKSDSVNYLKTTKEKYDLVFSLWSFSHSIHQHMEQDGVKEASEYMKGCLTNFFTKNLNPGGKLFLIHFDSRSEEQIILMRQWSKFFPTFKDTSKQSQSKLLLDKIFKDLQREKVIENLKIQHLVGEPIMYPTLEEALEIFINFHMETEFNRSPRIGEILKEIRSDISKHRRKNGHFFIKPGCFIYTFQKANTKAIGRRNN